MKYVVVDDEMLARERLKRLLSAFNWQCVGEAQNAKQAFEVIQSTSPSTVFLDINMPEESGLELAKKLSASLPTLNLVFVTAYPEHALDAFEVFAKGYLLKPIDPKKLEQLVGQLPTGRSQHPDKITVQLGNVTSWITINGIIAAFSEDKLTKLVHQEGVHYVDIPLKQFVAKYSDVFIQIHRNTIVNRAFLTGIKTVEQSHFACVKGIAEPLVISRRAYQELKTILAR
ncbi:LytR/AlgR family response regulator transcription factor [Pseudoalteromonas xiamenensis]